MHKYLEAIGFSNMKSRIDLTQIIDLIRKETIDSKYYEIDDKVVFTEYSKAFGEKIGLIIRGDVDQTGNLYLDHITPYFKNTQISLTEEIAFQKRTDIEAYSGIAEDYRLGVTLAFYLNNCVDYELFKASKKQQRAFSVSLSALSIEGKILLPTANNKKAVHKASDLEKKNILITEAKNGNQEAIESLTIEEIDNYAHVTRRMKSEDIYSIVDTSFVPYGLDSDQYSILGIILKSKLVQNNKTKEQLYHLMISCNDLQFPVCINKKDLLGEPAPGRRFKGIIWMQGTVNFC